MTQQSAHKDGRTGVSWLARGVALLGLVFFTGSVAILAYEGLFSAGGPPVMRAKIIAVQPQGDQWHVRIRIDNDGGSTGAAVRVVADLTQSGRVVEQADVEFAYVPAGSWQEGGLIFRHDPARNALALRVVGYVEP